MEKAVENIVHFEETIRADEKVRAEAYIALARLCEYAAKGIKGVGMESIAATADTLHAIEPVLYKIARSDGLTPSRRREYVEAVKERYPFLFK